MSAVARPLDVHQTLTPGEWTLAVSAHTVASDQCELSAKAAISA